MAPETVKASLYQCIPTRLFKVHFFIQAAIFLYTDIMYILLSMSAKVQITTKPLAE